MRAALALVVACAHAPPEAFRPPNIAESLQFTPPPIAELALSNGIRVLVVENHRLPIVAVTTVHGSAGSRDDGDHPGLAALTLDALDEPARELADALDADGARLELDIATDYAAAHLTALSDHVDAAVDALAATLRRPRLADADLARLRAEHAVELAQHRERARTVAAQVFDRLVFGAHPYAHPAEGTVDAVAALTADDVRGFWARAYGPATTTVIVVGDVTADHARRALERAFGDWRGPAAPPVAPPLPAWSPRLVYVDVPGAAETAVVIGRRVTVAPDRRIAADVANAVLGGTAASRLDRALQGVAFGVGSSFWRGAWAGTWSVATAVRTDATGAAIRSTLAAIAAATQPSADELARAKARLVRGLAQAFDTTTGTARVLERLVALGLPTSELASYADRIAAVTVESAHAAVAPIWTELAIVVVGDRAKLDGDLRALGLPVEPAP